MSLIQLPQPGPAAQTAGLLRNRGAISAGSQEAQSWEALAALGQKLEQKADEWRQRQDRFAIAMATVDMDQERDAWEVKQDRRTDLHLLDKDGIVGYDAAVNDYGKYLEDITNKTGSRIPKSYRQMWMAQQKQENETRLAKFTNAMIDRRTADSKVFFWHAIRRLTTGEGFQVPGMMGAPTTTLPVNPEAAIEFAVGQIDVFDPKDQQAVLDRVVEEVFYGILNQSPESALAFLEKSKDRFDTKTFDRLKATVNADLAAERAAQEKMSEDMIRTNSRKVTAKVYSGEITKPSEIIAMMESDDPAVQIREETGRMLIEKLKKPDKADDPATRERAYGIMARATNRYKAGKISYDEWNAIFEAHAPELAEEDVESFIDATETRKATEGDRETDAAQSLAEKALKPLFTTAASSFGDEEVDVLGLDAAVGGIVERLDKWRKETFTDARPFDSAMFRRKANEVIGEVMQEIQKSPGQLEETPASKKQGWLSKKWSGPKIPEGQPTPDELRQQNTREAYEQGKKLGYWQ